jgi:hypothetical protein
MRVLKSSMALTFILWSIHAFGGDLEFVGAVAEKPRVSAFASEPVITKAGTKYEVRFAVKSETDVTIEIVDAQNKVVRHLASGVLGPKAPEPFKVGSLEQSVAWDGKDDHGKDVSGSCKARVGLGLKPTLEKVIGGSGQNVGNAIGLATGKEGTLYYMYVSGEGHHTAGENFICAFDRNGKYLRQLMPMPANLTREQVSGTGALPVGETQWMPILYHGLVHTLYPDVTGSDRQTMAVGSKKLYMVGNDGSGKMVLLRIGLDGSVGKDFIGPVIGDSHLATYIHLALSPDEKYIYASGLDGSGRWNYKPLHNVVYRAEPDGQKPFEPFIGEFGKSGSDKLTDPRGIAVDKDGNIYVAESAGNRVSIWSPQGRMIGSLSAPAPDQVAVHPKTGAVYVLSSPTTVPADCEAFLGGSPWLPKKKLLKFNTNKDTKEASSLAFPEAKLGGGKAVMALDPNVEPPIVWIGAWAYGVQSGAKKIVDNGSTLEVAGDPIRDQYKDKFPFMNPKHMSVDRHDTELTVNGYRFNPVSGECLGELPYFAKFHQTIARYGVGEETLSPDGDFLIHRSGMGQVVKLKPDASALDPFSDGSAFAEPGSAGPEGKCKVEKLFGGFMHPRGIGVAPNDEVYVVHHQDHFRNRHMTAVSEVGVDGTIKRYEYIKLEAPSACVRVDSRGNTYLGTTVRPADESAPNQRIDEGKAKWSSAFDPKSVRGKIPAVEGSWFLTPGFWYTMCTGSIVKFGPDGGKVTRGGPLLLGTDTGGDIAWIMNGNVEGGKWAYFGCSPMPYKGAGATAGGCICETARFDVDGHDRLFVPEAMRFSVAVLDANGNFICRFGSYGNLDSRGKGSAVPEVEIPFGWPMAVTVSDTAAYVGDNTNFRVMKVKLEYAVEKTVNVK